MSTEQLPLLPEHLLLNLKCDTALQPIGPSAQERESCAEMEKRADAADTSVLFFSLAVLIFWL